MTNWKSGLPQVPVITVPTITLEGDANGAPHPDPSAYAKKFSGKYAASADHRRHRPQPAAGGAAGLRPGGHRRRRLLMDLWRLAAIDKKKRTACQLLRSIQRLSADFYQASKNYSCGQQTYMNGGEHRTSWRTDAKGQRQERSRQRARQNREASQEGGIHGFEGGRGRIQATRPAQPEGRKAGEVAGPSPTASPRSDRHSRPFRPSQGVVINFAPGARMFDDHRWWRDHQERQDRDERQAGDRARAQRRGGEGAPISGNHLVRVSSGQRASESTLSPGKAYAGHFA